jgi:hypothetical protein
MSLTVRVDVYSQANSIPPNAFEINHLCVTRYAYAFEQHPQSKRSLLTPHPASFHRMPADARVPKRTAHGSGPQSAPPPPTPNSTPRANRIAPRCHSSPGTSTPLRVMRKRRSPRIVAATSRTCGINARQACSSASSARATSEGQMDECAARRDNWRTISRAMVSGLNLAPTASAARSGALLRFMRDGARLRRFAASRGIGTCPVAP